MTRTYVGVFEIEIDERDKIEDVLKDIKELWNIEFEDIHEWSRRTT